jgi:ankyrin repeat protein
LESQQQQQQQQQQPQRAFNGVEAREAIKLGDAASLETILSSGQVDPNYRDGHGFTLLMLAAMFNKKECCLKLLASGARKELVNKDNETAIDLAPVSLANIIRQYK